MTFDKYDAYDAIEYWRGRAKAAEKQLAEVSDALDAEETLTRELLELRDSLQAKVDAALKWANDWPLRPAPPSSVDGLLVILTDPPQKKVEPELPHSRACGYQKHEHGYQCHRNCPTCAGGGQL